MMCFAVYHEVTLPSFILILALTKEPSTTTNVVNAGRSTSSSLSPPPPDLQSRLSTPSSDDLAPPRLSLSHDPLAPTRTLARTPPTRREDDTLQSIEAARRAAVTRLSDRLSFGAPGSDDVDDTMMDILANRQMDHGGFADESMEFDQPTLEFYRILFEANGSDDTVDLRGGDVDGEGEYTEGLGRLSSPDIMMDLDVAPTIKPRKPLKQQKSVPLNFSHY